MKKALLFLALALVLALVPSTVMAEEWETKPIPSDVEAGVVCVLDECMMPLPSCDNQAAQKLRAVIKEKMFKDGLNKEQTFAYLAEVYGEKVLAAPPKKGFNWTAWITPFVATIGGGAIIYLGLEKWVIPAWKKEDDEETAQIDPEYEEQLNKELKKYL